MTEIEQHILDTIREHNGQLTRRQIMSNRGIYNHRDYSFAFATLNHNRIIWNVQGKWEIATRTVRTVKELER